MSHRLEIDNAAIPARSKQNLSCNWTGSADFGRLVPIHWEELLQTDKVISFKPRIEMQMLPFASPTFTKIDLYVHGFVVPLRQIQKTFYEMWSRTGVNKDSSFQWISPKNLGQCYRDITTGAQLPNFRRALFKHWTSLGVNPFFALFTTAGQTPITDNLTPLWLAPFFAYNKIWWDFYRDPELLRDESKSYYLYDGDFNNSLPSGETFGGFAMKYFLPHVRSIKNCWLADLFASGGQDVTNVEQLFTHPQPFGDVRFDDYKVLDDEDATLLSADGQISGQVAGQNGSIYNNVYNTNNASAQLRLMEALTRLSERLSLSGKREIEALFARYGVKPKWSEMNLCRYVGGGKTSVMVSDIISTADTGDDGSPLGAKAGAGYCALDSVNFSFSVDEPSIFMVVASVMPHIHFVQGLSKKFQRKQLTDMFQSSLQYIGNVGVAKREVGFKYSAAAYDVTKDGEVFAYSDPYYEYKSGLDILAGDFMTYHDPNMQGTATELRQIHYMQSMENYIDFPLGRTFQYDNMLVDGDQFNKVFSYLGGSYLDEVDDHFHLCIDKEFIIDRPMEGFAIPTIETTQDPHQRKTNLSQDVML